ncbi:MAG: hypothetical protein AB7I33_12790, partial [Gemmatimonadales bacterium]
MTARSASVPTVELSGLDGSNPLGFLAALGTLVILKEAGARRATLRWKAGMVWTPEVAGVSTPDPVYLSGLIAQALQGREVPADAAARCDLAKGEFDKAKNALNAKQKEIRGRKLKGAARRQAFASEVASFQGAYDTARQRWLQALEQAAPRPELALGSRIDCSE